MQISIIGILIVAALMLLGRAWGSTLMIALFASLTFGSTAFAVITALGGSSPQIYTLLAAMMIAVTLFRPGGIQTWSTILTRFPVGWCILLLVIYTVIGSYLFPRLYAGQVLVFVNASVSDLSSTTGIGRGIKEAALGPVSGNTTQAAYFCLSLLSFFAIAAYLAQRGSLASACQGLFAFAIFTALFGVLDLTFKLIGIPDIFEPIRTATYSMSTTQAESGFWRIAGGFPEASSYAMAALAAVAFSFTYWRLTGSNLALLLVSVLSLLLLLSTSTTAYVALLVLCGVAGLRALNEIARNRISRGTVFILAFGVIAFACVNLLAIAHDKIFHSLIGLYDSMLLNKAGSASAMERGYWNAKSLEALFSTSGLGIGIGSSRSSSLPIAYASQLGVPALLLVLPIIASTIWWPIKHSPLDERERQVEVLGRAASASAFAWLLGLSISAGSADIGVYFFACMAVVVTCRWVLQASPAAVQRIDWQYRQASANRVRPAH